MPEERQFPRGSRVDDLDLSGVHLHGTNLEGARLTEAYLVDADISGDIEGLRLNGVEIEPLVRAELDRLYPDRVSLRASDVAGLREAWSMVERLWAATTERALRLPEAVQCERVGGEWSIVETLRHLVFATDCWLFRAIRLEPGRYHPWGLPWSGAGPEFTHAVGVDTSASPSLEEAMPVRRHVLQCLHVLLNEDPAKASAMVTGAAVARGARRSYDQPRGFLATRSPFGWPGSDGLRYRAPAKPLFPRSRFGRVGPARRVREFACGRRSPAKLSGGCSSRL